MRDLYGYTCKQCFIEHVYLCARAQTSYFQETTFDNALKTEIKIINSTCQAGGITYSFDSPELVLTRRGKRNPWRQPIIPGLQQDTTGHIPGPMLTWSTISHDSCSPVSRDNWTDERPPKESHGYSRRACPLTCI